MPIITDHERYTSYKPDMRFNDIHSLTDLTGRAVVYYGNGVTPVQIQWSSQPSSIDDTVIVTSTEVAAILDSCTARVSGTETWQMLEGILGRPDITPLGIDKIVAFGLGNLTAEAVPGEECQTSCMQHAFLLRLGNLLRETMGHSVRCVAQDPAYLDTCKEALRARGVEIAEPESGFLLVDERTLVFTVSCNVPVRQIVTELAHPAGMIWGYVEPDEVLREWTRNEEGIWVFPYTTDHSSSRVREMVKGYNEYPLPEEDAACLWGSALYIRKETTETT